MSGKRLAGFCLLGAVLLASPVFAGGPLIIWDAPTRTPIYYPPGTVDVFTDLGANGPLSNDESDVLVQNCLTEWTAVPTSYFSAAVAGDITVGGVPADITPANVDSVIFNYNGGGIHFIYDSDGTIVSSFFGAPPGVAGIASPEYTETGSPVLLESWVVINGSLVDPGDTSPIPGATYGGVYTHEFGHAINLAHTQTNGAKIFLGDEIGASGCPILGGTTFADTETMYPFIDPTPGSTGLYQATVEQLDDVAVLSDIYPDSASTWPLATGTITGTIFLPDSTELTGVNVIARNLANPVGDANSALSGDYTQGKVGADGLYTLNGLTPGAEYVVYVDNLGEGGFSTPNQNAPVSPAPTITEEYWNGALESGNAETDTACSYVAITAVAGVPVVADIYVNVDLSSIVLGDDDAVEVPLPFSFPFCGTDYNSVWVNSNGSVSFGAGDPYFFFGGSGDLLLGPPRIAPLWTDLTPDLGGSVSAEEVGSDFVITFNAIPEWLFGGSNTFSVTLRPNGTHLVSYGSLTASGGLFGIIAGRSPGGGATDPGQTDLSTAPQPLGAGSSKETVYQIFAGPADLASLDLEFAACGGQTAVDDPDGTPSVSALMNSRPNPFRSSTVIAFELPTPGPVRLRIFDITGRLVRTLANDHFEAGRYSLPWNGVDDMGRAAGPGIYFYRLEAPNFTASQKAVLID